MKKFFLAIIVMAATLSAAAQGGLVRAHKIYAKSADLTVYQQKDAISTENGRVILSREVEVPGKSKEELFKIASAWMALRFEPNTRRGDWKDANSFRNTEYSKVKDADKESGLIVAQGAEEMIFTNKTLSKDFAHVYYLLDAKVENGKISLKMHNISYIYTGNQDNTRYPAEEMLTDEYAFNKKGELSRAYGKFRIKTIDLIDQFAEELKADCSK